MLKTRVKIKPQMIDLKKFIEKVEQTKKTNKLDLSSNQDLSIALMNLISIEEHFFFSGAKTGDKKHYDMLAEIREIRKALLKKLVPNHTDGSERWCISKHLLAASMRLMETGTKQIDLGNKGDGYDFFQKAYDLYALFWGINLNAIDIGTIKHIDDNALDKNDLGKSGLRGALGKLVKKIIDCCLE